MKQSELFVGSKLDLKLDLDCGVFLFPWGSGWEIHQLSKYNSRPNTT